MKLSDLYGKRIDLIDLIEFGEKGLKDMYEYSKASSFYQYMEYKPHKTIEEAKEYLNELIRRSSSKTGHYWFIFLKAEKKMIGTFGIINIDERKEFAEIGYGISPNYWGHGYFCETLMLVLNHLFIDLTFHRVSAVTQADNLPSIEALTKCGFQKEGMMRDYYLSLKDGKRYDAFLMSILKDEFLLKSRREYN